MTREVLGEGIFGVFRDVLRGADGAVVWDSGWQRNAIVVDCRRLLAVFMRRGPANTAGISGLRVGAGNPAWDQPPGTPNASEAQSALVDPNFTEIPLNPADINFLSPTTPNVSGSPTNRLQVKAVLGPNVPPWPDANHPTSALREFGLVATLDGTPVLVNYRTHPAIAKDPQSTLERTIWLTF